MTTNKLICLENKNQGSRWIWTLDKHNKFCVIESTNFGRPESGYGMIFQNSIDFDIWLGQRINDGWEISKLFDFNMADKELFETAYQNIFHILQTPPRL